MRHHRELIDLMEMYAGRVDIDRVFPAEADGQVWAGRYAQIALCIVDECSVEALMNAKEKWQLKLDELLVIQEKANLTVIDGYLVLVLPERPDEALRGDIRSVEMDTFICRKHVVWPEDGDTAEVRWRNIFNVTALGLPPSPRLTAGARMPALGGEQKRIWNLIMEMGPERAAGKLLAEG